MSIRKSVLITVFALLIFSMAQAQSIGQKKFEFAFSFDPLIVPVNLNTFTEWGMGYYDIDARQSITQGAYANFAYWPVRHWGVSLGVGWRWFGSDISYAIPDPVEETGMTVFDGNYPFRAKGFGPVLALNFRMDRFRARIGFAVFELYDQEYHSINRLASTTTFNSPSDIIAQVTLVEKGYWNFIPQEYPMLQLRGQYLLFNNLFLTAGLETRLWARGTSAYAIEITGYTASMPKETHLLNDFRKQETFNSVSLGISYIFGFGQYRVADIVFQ
jgi:hypothetical protein